MNNKNIKWVNIYKAILIILMVIGHTTNIFDKYIYSFDIAGFFILSGYLFKDSNEDFIQYFKRKIKSLIFPYIKFVTALTIISIILSKFSNIFYSNQISTDCLYQFIRYLNTVDIAGALWFLPILFLTEILFKLLHDIVKNNKNSTYILLLVSILTALWGYTYYVNGETLSYNFDLVLLSIYMFSLGYLFSKVESKLKNEKIKNILFLFSVFVIFGLTKYSTIVINWPTRSFPNVFTMTILSTLGAYSVYFISNKLSKFKLSFINYIGENTIYILAYHFLGFRLLFYLLYLLKIVNLNQTQSLVPLYSNSLYGVLTALYAIIFSLLLNIIIKYIKKHLNNKIDFNSEKFISIFLILIVIAFNTWIFNTNNFFTFDDFSHLKSALQSSFSSLMQIVPSDVYNSRPIGWIFMKLLLFLFQYNYIYYSISLLLVHTLNTYLVYKVSKNLFKFNNFQSLIIALIFGVNPASIMAFTWESAVFDLLCCTIMLTCLLVFYKINNSNGKLKIFYEIILFLLYYIGLRTKEMIILLPCILIIYNFFVALKAKNKKFTIKEFILNNKISFILLFVMLVYFIYTRKLNISSTITNDINNPYYYVFSPVVLLKNIFKYIYLYFSSPFMKMTYGNPNKFGLMFTALIILFGLLEAIICLIKKRYKYIVLILSFIFIIAPVLPMKNMQHILYLYLPSVFLSMIIVEIFSKQNLIKENKLSILSLTLIILLFCNNFSAVNNFRSWWFSTTEYDKNNFNYLVSIKNKYKDIKNVYLININNDIYYSYYYGPGDIIRVAFQNNNLNVYVNSKNEYDESDMVIDCNYSNKCAIIGEK